MKIIDMSSYLPAPQISEYRPLAHSEDEEGLVTLVETIMTLAIGICITVSMVIFCLG